MEDHKSLWAILVTMGQGMCSLVFDALDASVRDAFCVAMKCVLLRQYWMNKWIGVGVVMDFKVGIFAAVALLTLSFCQLHDPVWE